MRRAIAVLAMAAAGCAGDDGSGGPKGAAGDAALFATDVEAPGGNCPLGGTRLRTGTDLDGDGLLGDTEIAEVRYVCNGDGVAALVSIEDGAAGCTSGGITVRWGLDADGDGALSEAERTGSAAVCNGAAGAIQIVEPVAPGAACAAGGFTLSYGHDTDGDGTLDPDEIEGASTICNGVDGLVSLVDHVELKAGSEHCANGGVLIRSGLDADRDGALDDEEVARESALCVPCDHPGSRNCTSGTLVQTVRLDVAYRPGHLAAGDIDGDGVLDVLIGQFDRTDVETWRGRGDGSFEAPVPAGSGVHGGFPVLLGQFDGDAHLDLVGCNSSGGLVRLPGNGDGTFGAVLLIAASEVNSYCASMKSLDYDGDGITDLAFSNTISVALLRGTGDGTFVPGPRFPASSAHAFEVTSGDLDGDGDIDLAWVESLDIVVPGALRVAINQGDGTFAEPTSTPAPLGASFVQLGHFNGDAHLDVLVAGENERQFELRLGDGAGGFGAAAIRTYANHPGQMAVADFDGDDHLDVVMTESGGTTSIYRGNGDGTLADFSFRTTGGGGSYLVLADFDDDGKQDVVVTHYNSQRLDVLRGD